MSLTPQDLPSFGQLLFRQVKSSPKYRTQEDFAHAIGRDVTTVRDWFSDRTKPSRTALRDVLTWLYGRDRSRHLAERQELLERWAERPERNALVKTLLVDPSTRKQWAAAVKAFDDAEHPLIQQAITNRFAAFLSSLDGRSEQAPWIDHKDFSFLAARYLQQARPRVRALTRVGVTNWEPLFSSGSEYLKAQRGLDVQRVFVLQDVDQYNKFSADIFPLHAKTYGASNVLVCSAQDASTLIESLPGGSPLGPQDDFALFGDDLVAFCQGKDRVLFRTDNWMECTRVFNAVAEHAIRRDQSFLHLAQGGQGAGRRIFNLA